MGLAGGGGNTSFTFKMLIFSMVIMIMLPMLINIYTPQYLDVDRDEVLDGYYQMTGQTAPTSVSIWPLTGIYEPYSGGPYGYSDDGWLFGAEIKGYMPHQYQGTGQEYIVYKDDRGVFRYLHDSADYNQSTGTGHRGQMFYDDSTDQWVPYEDGYAGDLYTAVSFDTQHKSDVFFTEASRSEMADGHFYYNYSGYRMSFQPISNYTAMNADGVRVPVIATTTSLSLIWYEFYSLGSGISGNLVLSGSSSGVAYINAAQILSAFNSTTSTASFDMVFNGISMTIIFRLDPFYLSQGWTVQDVYNGGFWSIMVTSQSADANAYVGTDYSLSPTRILETIFDLFTFNYTNYNMSDWLGVLCSIVIALPLYAILLSLCLEYSYLWILVGLLAAVQALSALWPF